MPFALAIERRPGYARFGVAGPASLKNYFDLIEQARQATQEQGDTLALVDLRGVIGRLQFTEQFFIGELAAGRLGHLQRVAIVVADDPASYNSPTVASRLGLQLRSFGSDQDALAWLLAD